MSRTADPTVSSLINYLNASPTPHHAVASAADMLVARGFLEVHLRAPPERLPPGTLAFVRNNGSIIAFRVGIATSDRAGFRLVTAHTDSPNLRVKPEPELRDHGWVRLGVEKYGGLILATWLDRDLGVAGRIVLKGGETRLVDIRRPVCRIPNLAIHLNRAVNDDGLKVNPQTQMPALLTLDDGTKSPFRELLASTAGVLADQIRSFDLSLVDVAPSSLGGLHDEFIFSGRLDNLASCHAALLALVSQVGREVPAHTSVVALFDHEEVGSVSTTGADGRMLASTLEMILAATGSRHGLGVAAANSFMVSADMAHAIHPAYADKHDSQHAPRLGGGPVIKQNVTQRYATDDRSAARFADACDAAGVPHQWFVSRQDVACGSTVGPMVAAQLGIPGVDVGNPMVSMHSIREMAAAADHPRMAAALAVILGS